MVAPPTSWIAASLQQALVAHQAGNLAAAEGTYRALLAQVPTQPDALHLLGVLCYQTNRAAEAAGHLQLACRLLPSQAAFHDNLGNAWQALGRLDDAIAAHRRALTVEPRFATAHNNLGRALAAQGLHEAAAAALATACRLAPNYAVAWLNRGLALESCGQVDVAAECYERALRLHPDDHLAALSLGATWQKLGRAEDARRAYEQALAHRPRSPELHSNLGVVCEDLGDFDAAVEHYDRAVALDPSLAAAWLNLSNARNETGRHETAIEAAERALALQPHWPAARFNRSLAQLALGRLAQGWDEYALRGEAIAGLLRPCPLPAWDGQATDEAVFLFGEQGVGTEVMFASCLADALAILPRCIVECDPRLARLFARSFAQADIVTTIDRTQPRSPHGAQRAAGFGDLPRWFRRAAGDFPRRAYLQPEAAAVEAWRQRLAVLAGGLRVGLSWRGGRTATMQGRRSLTSTALAALVRTPGVAWVNLQYDATPEELASIEWAGGARLASWPDFSPREDLDRLAALALACDLVVTVDNSTAHLAGAVGATTWVLLPAAADWRWFTGRRDSPWYPGVELFRQTQAGAWDDVIAQLIWRLSSLAEAKRVQRAAA